MKFLTLLKKPISFCFSTVKYSVLLDGVYMFLGVFVNFQNEIFYQQCYIECGCGGGGVCGISCSISDLGSNERKRGSRVFSNSFLCNAFFCSQFDILSCL